MSPHRCLYPVTWPLISFPSDSVMEFNNGMQANLQVPKDYHSVTIFTASVAPLSFLLVFPLCTIHLFIPFSSFISFNLFILFSFSRSFQLLCLSLFGSVFFLHPSPPHIYHSSMPLLLSPTPYSFNSMPEEMLQTDCADCSKKHGE